MKKTSFIIALMLAISASGFSQLGAGCEGVSIFKKSSSPDLGIILSTNDAETIWNALRLAIYSQEQGDTVSIFVLGKALDVYINDTSKYKINELSLKFFTNGGYIYACATCAKQRNTENVPSCTVTSIKDLYLIVKRSKKVLTF
jgi:hypothetical protein